MGEKCLLPYYHMVSDEDVPHVSSLYAYRNVARFTEDLELLARGRKALSLEEFLTAVRTNGSAPDNSFLLTFDDGFREMHDVVAPILAKKGIPAVFFVMSDMLDNNALCFQQKISLLVHRMRQGTTPAIEAEAFRLLRTAGIPESDLAGTLKAVPWSKRAVLDDVAQVVDVPFDAYLQRVLPYLTTKQITSLLDRGFTVGAHSLDHPRYADIPLSEQLRQTRESVRALTTRFSLKHRTFAFPHTDRQVSAAFFNTLTREGIVEATFGTAGPSKDSAEANHQRFSMEKPDLPGKALLAGHAFRRRKHHYTRRRPIIRT